MRRPFLCFVLATGLSLLPGAPFSAHAQEREGAQMKTLPQGELDVVKVLMAQERTWNSGDLQGFLSSYKKSPDTLFLGSALARGYDELVARYLKNYPDRSSMGVLTFSDLEPHLLDERFAILTGQFHLERAKKNGGNAGGVFSLVLEKTGEGWKIVLDHTS